MVVVVRWHSFVVEMAQLLSGMFIARKLIKELKSDASAKNRFINALELSRLGGEMAVKSELVEKTTKASITTTTPPCLAIIETGATGPPSALIKTCVQFAVEVGVVIRHYTFSETITQDELIEHIHMLNDLHWVHGIFVVMPLRSINPIDVNVVFDAVITCKDVCGMNSLNRVKICNGDFSAFLPCPANACFELIKHSKRRIDGAHVVILGRSTIGLVMPLAEILRWHNATVTICNSHTKNLTQHTRQADILVVAIGIPEYVHGGWIKPGAVVIDCGNNHICDPFKAPGVRTVGDVIFEEAIETAGYLTVVPNGIATLSIASLLQNTLKSYDHYTLE